MRLKRQRFLHLKTDQIKQVKSINFWCLWVLVYEISSQGRLLQSADFNFVVAQRQISFTC